MSWQELGKRIAQAREVERLTQGELAALLDVDRTAISKMENGQRAVSTLEIARIAEALHRSVTWFLREPPAPVVSRRAGRDGVLRREDITLEELVQDVEQLMELDELRPIARAARRVTSMAEAEDVAMEIRREVGLHDEAPAWELISLAEQLGMYTFVLDLAGEASEGDGSYVALQQAGVALVGASADSGRRRFTIAHELGHHVFADEYASEWFVNFDSNDTEKVVNAFAVHFLLPRAAVQPRWASLRGKEAARAAAIHIAVEFGVSWSVVCAQLQRFGLLQPQQYEELTKDKPTSFDFLEHGLRVRDDVKGPQVPPRYATAVTRALRKGSISATRALELLRGTVLEQDLPPERQRSLDEMAAEIDLLP